VRLRRHSNSARHPCNCTFPTCPTIRHPPSHDASCIIAIEGRHPLLSFWVHPVGNRRLPRTVAMMMMLFSLLLPVVGRRLRLRRASSSPTMMMMMMMMMTRVATSRGIRRGIMKAPFGIDLQESRKPSSVGTYRISSRKRISNRRDTWRNDRSCRGPPTTTPVYQQTRRRHPPHLRKLHEETKSFLKR